MCREPTTPSREADPPVESLTGQVVRGGQRGRRPRPRRGRRWCAASRRWRRRARARGRSRSPSGSSSTAMLMMPPALATKSGAQRMPRACRSAASSSEASWLFAAPATARQRSAGHGVVVEHAAERARRDDVDLGAQRLGGLRPGGAELVGERAPGRGDVGRRRAARRRRRGRGPARRRRGRGRSPRRCARRGPACPTGARRRRGSPSRRRARSTGSGRPEPPRSGARPGDVLRPLGDHRHVLVGRPDVLRGDVAPVELRDAVAEVEQRVAAPGGCQRRRAGGQHDHALPAAERQVRRRRT